MRLLFLMLSVLAAASVPLNGALEPKVLYEKQSHHHYIRVLESGTVRTLTFRRKGHDRNQSRMDVADPLRPCLPYYPLMFAGYLFTAKPERVLVVGLGAGVVSRLSAHYFPEAKVDSIELDPAVVEVAKRFFAFEEGERQRVFIRDARVQIKVLRHQHAIYDIIMLDAFRGGFVPYSLMTREFFRECRDILSPDGALVVNLKPDWVIYEYQRRTLASVFPEQYAFGGDSGSQMVVALPSEKQMTKEQLLTVATTLQEQRKFSFSLPRVVTQFDMGPTYSPKGMIFTDGHVPANILKRQLEGPSASYSPPAPAFGRLADWLRNNRLPVIFLALVLIVVALASQKARRARAFKKLAPGEQERKAD